MKDSELIKLQFEFARTPFDIRAKVFSIIPLLLFLYFIVSFFASRGGSMEQELRFILLTNACISLVGTCIAQLQYGKMLNDYINARIK